MLSQQEIKKVDHTISWYVNQDSILHIYIETNTSCFLYRDADMGKSLPSTVRLYLNKANEVLGMLEEFNINDYEVTPIQDILAYIE